MVKTERFFGYAVRFLNKQLTQYLDRKGIRPKFLEHKSIDDPL